jgi:hypothetical protein
MALKPQPQATSNILKGDPNNWTQAWAEYWASLDLTVRTDDATLAGLVTTVAGLGGGGIQGSFKNLSIKVATTTTVAVAADFVVVSDGTNFKQIVVSATCDLSTNGAVNKLDAGSIAIDKWYFIFAIAQAGGASPGTLASLSSTAPTLPSGYTMFGRIGAVQTIHATATLYGTWQLGRRAQYVQGLASGTPTTTTTPGPIASGTVGTYSLTSPTLSAVTVSGNGKYVPTTASHIHLIANNDYKAGGGSQSEVAPSQSYSGVNNGPAGSNGLPWPYNCSDTANATVHNFWLLLETTTVSVATTTAAMISCMGWEDNI